jgi:hypothetical protein
MKFNHQSTALLTTTVALLLFCYNDNNALFVSGTTTANDADRHPHHGYMRGACKGVEEEADTTISTLVRLKTRFLHDIHILGSIL